MTRADLKNLSKALQYKENKEERIKRMNKIFRNKKCRTIIKETKDLMYELRGNERNNALLVVVMSLLYKNVGLIYDIKKALETERLISSLYGGLKILLLGKSSTMCLKINLTDSQFPNRYEYLVRFTGQFAEPQYREVLYAVKILALSDRKKFEKLAIEDSTYLILLNMQSFILDERPSEGLIRQLIIDGDELQANIGFYFAVWDVTIDIRNYEQLERNQNNKEIKSKDEIDGKLGKDIDKFYGLIKDCCVERKASLFINYILYENRYPKIFGYWLMEEESRDAFINEITSSNKIRGLFELYKIMNIIKKYPCKNTYGANKKDKLYKAIVKVIKDFIENDKGIYSWDNKQKKLFCDIAKALPKKYLTQLLNFLRKKSQNFMVSPLDEMVRFSIYLKDKRQFDICEAMINVIVHEIESRLSKA